MISIGFTGTREGFTEAQRKYFEAILAGLALANRYGDFHHGDCQGADAEAHDMVRALCPDWTIHIHPGPEGDSWRAHKTGDKTYEPKDALRPQPGHRAGVLARRRREQDGPPA
jgi:hypothetical protein